MIYRNGTDAAIERHKERLGLTGEVYMIGCFIENLESHKILIPDSTATTIEEAEAERIAYDAAILAQQTTEAEAVMDEMPPEGEETEPLTE